MNQAIAQYCENCGQPLGANVRFCPSCGHAVPQDSPAPAGASAPAPAAQPAAAPQPAAPAQVASPDWPAAAQRPPTTSSQPAEFIIAALPPGTRRSGLLGLRSEAFVLVLTDLRILLAKQTSQMMKENARQAREAAKQSGQGLLSQWGAVIASNSSSQRYLQMNPQQILGETAENYALTNNQILSVRVSERVDQERAAREVRLRIKTTGGKLQFVYAQASRGEIKQTLQQTLGDKVR